MTIDEALRPIWEYFSKVKGGFITSRVKITIEVDKSDIHSLETKIWTDVVSKFLMHYTPITHTVDRRKFNFMGMEFQIKEREE